MNVPHDNRTYLPFAPNVRLSSDAMLCFAEVAKAARFVVKEGGSQKIDLRGLPTSERACLEHILGKGEVSIRIDGASTIDARESIFAGVWLLKGDAVDMLEVATVPELALSCAFKARRPFQGNTTPRIEGFTCAPALFTEMLD